MPFVHDLAEINSDFTPDAIASIDEIIDRLKDKPGSLIPVLTCCQGVLGYLPVELQEYIGRRMNIPASDIYGVVTFYSFFTMIPKGRHTIKVCMGTACYVRGMGEILNRIRNGLNLEIGATSDDRRFSLDAVRCLGACGLAPVVVVDEDTHGGVTPDTVLDILNSYK
ncbi:MAG: NAD(P)H-dependent oxidoreductase subunit E [Deltaproteobacteria bacterium]|nr:NAD(P)H-dependent oxidoreductase subunit E [Deltaproteobacteria bacterium]